MITRSLAPAAAALVASPARNEWPAYRAGSNPTAFARRLTISATRSADSRVGWIAYGQGMSQYLWASQVLLKDFGSHVEQVSERLKAASLAEVVAAGRPVRYLASLRSARRRSLGVSQLKTGLPVVRCAC